MDKELKCKKGCCALKFTTSIHAFNKEIKNDECIKAGVAIITDDEETKRKILITQSYNRLWGVPKGKKEGYETLLECASRELEEESGVKIPSSCLKSCEKIIFVPSYDKRVSIHIYKYTMSTLEYITCGMSTMKVEDLHQDSTGFGWIDIDCLKNEKKIKLNSLTKFVLKKLG
jgi:8-oxo-dGTP pyrophosphatase MutT (NUDIX family)